VICLLGPYCREIWFFFYGLLFLAYVFFSMGYFLLEKGYIMYQSMRSSGVNKARRYVDCSSRIMRNFKKESRKAARREGVAVIRFEVFGVECKAPRMPSDRDLC
jgi:hypothetical protein